MDLDTLRRIEPLSSYPRHRLAELSRRLEWRRYAPGELILPHQVPICPHGLVVRGRVEVTTVQQGHRQKVGCILAEEPIPHPLYAFDASAVELRAVEATTLCWLPAEALEVEESQAPAPQPAPPPTLAQRAFHLAGRLGSQVATIGGALLTIVIQLENRLAERLDYELSMLPVLLLPALAQVSDGLVGLLDAPSHKLRTALRPALATAANSFARLWEPLPALGQLPRPKGIGLLKTRPFAHRQRATGLLFFSILLLLPLTVWLWQSPLTIVRAKLAYALASRQLARGHTAEALLLLENSVALNPGLAMAYNDIGAVYHQWGWARQAQKAFQQAVAADPTSAVALNNLGLSYLEEGQLALARETLQQAVVLDPENAAAWANLGLVAQRMGQTEDAISNYLAALRLDPLQVTARANLGLLYYEQGRFAEAQDQLEAALHAQPDLPAARAVLGALAMEAGDQVAARNALDAVAPRFAGDPVVHFFLGLWNERAGDRGQAEIEFARVMAMQPQPELAALVHSHLVYLAPSEEPPGPDR
jgi:tetratricopeptide (TPR) repeat protein/CRP-like cAMP-binding protein